MLFQKYPHGPLSVMLEKKISDSRFLKLFKILGIFVAPTTIKCSARPMRCRAILGSVRCSLKATTARKA